MTILVVDDNECSLKLCGIALREYAPHLQSDSRQAVANFIEIKPQLILIDCCMPYIDGFQIAKEIRQIDEKCKIIMMSATPHEEEKITSHCDAFFSKPFPPSKIRELVDQILNN